ncbi:hypothetical protein SAMN04487977_101541 [Treponema bryantii]|uniref:Uncharacterized protein n=1 Tax=Treponema bryantii TaxID=163 RepID=A0A1H9B1T6_9SPIR|nr:hypothetical protein [Treponema bryantii]SEP82697.1 hypothetical protein SAMN04487977_101541 [Treponema bryantii]
MYKPVTLETATPTDFFIGACYDSKDNEVVSWWTEYKNKNPTRSDFYIKFCEFMKRSFKWQELTYKHPDLFQQQGASHGLEMITFRERGKLIKKCALHYRYEFNDTFENSFLVIVTEIFINEHNEVKTYDCGLKIPLADIVKVGSRIEDPYL